MTVDQIPSGRFSTVTRLTRKALRLYDKRGLLVPKAKDNVTGYRYYTGDQIQRGVRIKHLSALGFGLEEIAEYLEAEDAGDTSRLGALVESRLRSTEEELARLRRVASLLDNNMEWSQKTSTRIACLTRTYARKLRIFLDYHFGFLRKVPYHAVDHVPQYVLPVFPLVHLSFIDPERASLPSGNLIVQHTFLHHIV
jgi:DNA-binding transcriptional MerR regulator